MAWACRACAQTIPKTLAHRTRRPINATIDEHINRTVLCAGKAYLRGSNREPKKRRADTSYFPVVRLAMRDAQSQERLPFSHHKLAAAQSLPFKPWTLTQAPGTSVPASPGGPALDERCEHLFGVPTRAGNPCYGPDPSPRVPSVGHAARPAGCPALLERCMGHLEAPGPPLRGAPGRHAASSASAASMSRKLGRAAGSAAVQRSTSACSRAGARGSGGRRAFWMPTWIMTCALAMRDALAGRSHSSHALASGALVGSSSLQRPLHPEETCARREHGTGVMRQKRKQGVRDTQPSYTPITYSQMHDDGTKAQRMYSAGGPAEQNQGERQPLAMLGFRV